MTHDVQKVNEHGTVNIPILTLTKRCAFLNVQFIVIYVYGRLSAGNLHSICTASKNTEMYEGTGDL